MQDTNLAVQDTNLDMVVNKSPKLKHKPSKDGISIELDYV